MFVEWSIYLRPELNLVVLWSLSMKFRFKYHLYLIQSRFVLLCVGCLLLWVCWWNGKVKVSHLATCCCGAVVVVTFESTDEDLKCYHSNGSFWPILTVYLFLILLMLWRRKMNVLFGSFGYLKERGEVNRNRSHGPGYVNYGDYKRRNIWSNKLHKPSVCVRSYLDLTNTFKQPVYRYSICWLSWWKPALEQPPICFTKQTKVWFLTHASVTEAWRLSKNIFVFWSTV